MDGSGLREGDYAGLCALQSCYGIIAVTRREGKLWLVVRTAQQGEKTTQPENNDGESKKPESETEWAAIPLKEQQARLKLEVDFTGMKDTATFYYWKNDENARKSFSGRWEKVGPDHKLYFKLDHFVGCRFGLVFYSTLEAGGTASYREFQYRKR